MGQIVMWIGFLSLLNRLVAYNREDRSFRLLEYSGMESYYTTYIIDGIYAPTIISNLKNDMHE